jgi:hypothetical protein
MILETVSGRKVFLIEDPGKIAISAANGGPVELACGEQKTSLRVEVGYDQPPANLAGVNGVVRTLVF